MTQTVAPAEEGSGRAAWLALRAQLEQQESQRHEVEDAERERKNAALERFMDEKAAAEMNVDLTAPYGIGFVRWLRRRYQPRHWPRLRAGESPARVEFQLYLKAEGARLSGEYDVHARLSKTKPLRFSEPRPTYQARVQAEPQAVPAQVIGA